MKKKNAILNHLLIKNELKYTIAKGEMKKELERKVYCFLIIGPTKYPTTIPTISAAMAASCIVLAEL